MDIVIQAALAGLLQGLTEFIPISSSAHLELAPWIAGWESDGLIGSLAFDVFLHLGTLVALLVYFAGDLRALLPRRGSPASASDGSGPTPDRRLAWLLAHGDGAAARSSASRSRASSRMPFHGDNDVARLAIAGFLVLGASPFRRRRLGSRHARSSTGLTAPERRSPSACRQALALLPGISRSGATITAGLALGMTARPPRASASCSRRRSPSAPASTARGGCYETALSGSEWLASELALPSPR